MMPMLSTGAWVLHDLGLATAFGSTIFGKAALLPATRAISSEHERIDVVRTGWKVADTAKMIGFGTAAITWFIGRSMLNGRSIDSTTRNLVYVKDGLFAVAGVAAFAAAFTGYGAVRTDERVLAAASSDVSGVDAGARRMFTVSSLLGTMSLAAIAGVMGVTTVLAMKASTSQKFGLVSRLLP